MENIFDANNAAHGDFDISGVKAITDASLPEETIGKHRHAADDGNDRGEISETDKSTETNTGKITSSEDLDKVHGKESVADSLAEEKKAFSSDCECLDAEKEDREFISLIKGKYSEAYKRQVERIIRKRLKGNKDKRSVKSENASAEKKAAQCTSADLSELPGLNSDVTKNMYGFDKTGRENEISGQERTRQLLSVQKSQNLTRPRENGVGGSVGIFTGIKVSALKGSDVLALLRRAESGEKIKFN